MWTLKKMLAIDVLKWGPTISPHFFLPVGAPRRWKHAMAQVDVITVENSEQRDVVPNETQGCLDLKEKKPGLAGKGFGNCDWG